MPKYRVSLWHQLDGSGGKPGHVPGTDVLEGAETELEAAALGLADFPKLGKQFDLDSELEVRILNEDDELPEPAEGYRRITVKDVVDWANRDGKEFVTANNLEWLMTFK